MSKKYSAHFEDDDVVEIYDSETEAIGEFCFNLDNAFEFNDGDEVTFKVSEMLSALDISSRLNSGVIGEYIFEFINNWVTDEMVAEEVPLKIGNEKIIELGDIVKNFISNNATSHWYVVDDKNQKDYTHMIGSLN